MQIKMFFLFAKNGIVLFSLLSKVLYAFTVFRRGGPRTL